MKEYEKKLPVLDGVRALAILLVCIAHFFAFDENYLYGSNEILGIVIFKLSRIGLRGVELFFLLSGYLITKTLIESKHSKNYFVVFYARRFFRIFPLYYFVLFTSFILLPNIISVIDLDAKRVIQHQFWLWSYTSNLPSFDASFWNGGSNFPGFGHFWSLCVEEHFYIFWPFIIYFSNETWLPRFMWLLVFISVFVILLGHSSNNLLSIFGWTTIRCMGVLSLGGLIAYYKRHSYKYERLFKFSKRTISFFGLLLLIVSFIPRSFEFQEEMVYFIAVVFFAQLIIISTEGHRITDILFNHKPLLFIGKISYGIYVYHGFMMHIFENNHSHVRMLISNGLLGSTLYAFICTLISIFIAWLSWKIIEQPILKYKNKFMYS